MSGRLNKIRRFAAALSKEAKLFRMEQRALEAARLYSDLDCSIPFCEQVRRFETRLINQALELTDGHQKRAASLLGLQPTTLHEKMKRLGLLSGRTPKPE